MSIIKRKLKNKAKINLFLLFRLILNNTFVTASKQKFCITKN